MLKVVPGRVSEPLIESSQRSRRTSAQRRASASPRRRPVHRIRRWTLAQRRSSAPWRSCATCSGARLVASACVARGRFPRSTGLAARRPCATGEPVRHRSGGVPDRFAATLAHGPPPLWPWLRLGCGRRSRPAAAFRQRSRVTLTQKRPSERLVRRPAIVPRSHHRRPEEVPDDHPGQRQCNDRTSHHRQQHKAQL
jgi:hypothetical protein